MRVIRLVLLLLVCYICFVAPSLSQQRSAFGIYGDYNLNIYTADFRSFPNIPSCCPLYQNGSGAGITAGILYDLPLKDQVRLAIRGGYSSRNGTLKRTENTTVTGNIPGVFEHRVDALLSDIGLEPMLQYNPFSMVWLNLGGRIGYVTSNNFSQKETIISPTNGVFPTGSSTRNELTDQQIPNASSIYAAILGGISVDLPLNTNKTLILAPELLYSFGITPVVSGLTWNSNSLRFGIALKYSPLPQKEPTKRYEKKHSIDTIRIETTIAVSSIAIGKDYITESSQEISDEIIITETRHRTDTLFIPQIIATTKKQAILTANVTATGVEPDGTEKPTVKLKIEEFASVLMTPLLNYIFFDDNSSILPTRYKSIDKKETNDFNEKKINDANRLSTYYHILNIIGKRMKQNPDATLTLIGCNADIGAEKSNLLLSKRRAESVKEYLVQKWNLTESRIKIETRNLPEKAALSQTEDGYQENRRVEIIASNPAITAPIITNDTLRRANPPSVRFHVHTVSDNPIKQWSLTAEQDGKILKEFNGIGNVPQALDWNIDNDGTHPRSEQNLKYTLNVTDSDGKTIASDNAIPVEQTTIRRKQIERLDDKEINRYSLILFDVRSTEITTFNKPIIELIKKNIAPNSTVKIAGYTDRLGDGRTNQTLADGRARATATALDIPENSANISSKGNAEIYNPKLPEGRLYTRTVDVVIETPITE